MLLNSVVIILREVLEAAILISLFLAFSQRVNISRKWVVIALFFGMVFAGGYASNISTVSNWLDGVGQEVLNAMIQVVIYLILLVFSSLALSLKQPLVRCTPLVSLIILVVVLASIREGGEIMLYLYGFLTMPELLQSVLLGSAVGAGIGVSVGITLYYLLVSLPTQYAKRIGFILMMLVAGGMLSQAVQLLIQADWISSQYPLWDSSAILSEYSVTGQLMYALVGYEATPTPIQAMIYVIGLSLMLGVFFYHYYRDKGNLCP